MADRVLSRLSFLDRYLTGWIFSAMAIGVNCRLADARNRAVLEQVQRSTTSIPIAVGLIVMMYPPFTKVRYEEFVYRRWLTKLKHKELRRRRCSKLSTSCVLLWPPR